MKKSLLKKAEGPDNAMLSVKASRYQSQGFENFFSKPCDFSVATCTPGWRARGQSVERVLKKSS